MIFSSCVFKADEVKMKGFNRDSVLGGSTEKPITLSVTQVTLENDQLKISGENLDSVTTIQLQNENLSIVSQTAEELILTSATIMNLALNTAMDLILTNAYGQSVTSVQFNLVDGAVTAAKLADDSVTTDKIVDGAVTASKLSDMAAGIGQVLKFNGSTWVPGDLSSLTYAGNWDASGNSPDLSGGGNLGEFYIVNTAGSFDLSGGAGTNSWAVGDWAVWNNVGGQWEKIDNATNVQSFNGRSGTVSPIANDYTWNQIDKTVSSIADIADVDTTGVTDGKILKYQSGSWVIADDLSSGGAGSVSSSEIADGTITNADINTAAAIDQSKINGLPALATSVSTNTSDIATNSSNITSNDSDIATNASAISTNTSNISTNSSNISSNASAIATKANAAVTLSAGNGLSGGGDLSANRSFDVNVDGVTLEIASDTLQVKAISDDLITTACADGEVLSASSGAFVCAASTTVGNWTENSGDLYYTLGNVGVGLTNPSEAFFVRGNMAIFQNNSSTDGIIWKNPTYTKFSAGIKPVNLGANAIQGLGFYTGNDADSTTDAQERMRITHTGNVGIGNSNPTTKLHVTGTVTATAFSGDGSALTNVNAASANTVTASAGSFSAPSISFSGDPDTGLYSGVANTIEVTVGGTNIFDMSSSGIVSTTTGGGLLTTSNGNATTPTFSFSGDADTGWYRASENNLAAATGGVERVRINESGYLGINSNNPQATLHVNGSAIFNSGGGAQPFKILRSNANTNQEFLSTYVEDDKAHIFMSNDEDHSYLRFTLESTDLEAGGGADANTNTSLTLFSELGGSKVGIDRPAPDSKLHMYGLNPVLHIQNNDPINGAGGVVRFGHDQASSIIPIGEMRAELMDGSANRSGDLSFWTSNNGTLAEKVRITQEGYLGIGTTAPGSALDVQGVAKSNDGFVIRNTATANTSYDYLDFADSDGVVDGNILYDYNLNAMKFGLWDTSAGARATVMTILGEDGQVGIGTTTPTHALEVTGGGRLGGIVMGTSGTQVDFAYSYESIGTNTTGHNLRLQSGSSILFHTDMSGTEPDNNSKARMIIHAAGNVGIGTTSPAQKLDVNGNIAVGGTTVHTSDLRLKREIAYLENPLEKLLELEGVTYFWKDHNKDQHRQIGVIAQDVQKQFPEAIYENQETGFLSVNYSGLIAPIIESIKVIYSKVMGNSDINDGQNREIASLKEENEKMMNELEEVKKRNQKLEAYLCQQNPSAEFCD